MNYQKVIVQWKEFEVPKALPRLISVSLDSGFISTITGPRRAGKTYFCFQIINQLLKEGLSKENILYINFEDEKLIGANAQDLNGLLDAYYELSQPNKRQKIYLFLDEIQNVRDWDVWIRRIHDTEKNIKIILTGSSSKLLSKEISTKLRGRVINTEIFPLSFNEMLSWKKINYDLKTVSYSKARFQIKKLFSDYLKKGGFPAIIFNSLHEAILQSYLNAMIFRDIVERHNIKEVKKLKILISLLFESTASEISYSKLTNKLKSLGFSLSKNTVIEYISVFEDAYLFFQNLKYEYSLTKQLGAIKKIYCIDNGLLNAVSFRFSDDVGKLMENLVFIELKRNGREVYYHQQDYECDFLVKEKNKIVEALQVTYQLDDKDYKREIKGLLEALHKHNLNEGLILTYDLEKDIKVDRKKIKVVPLWKWLLTC